jgi:hypothetical protein
MRALLSKGGSLVRRLALPLIAVVLAVVFPSAASTAPFPASSYGLSEVIPDGPNVDRPVDLVMFPGSSDVATVAMQSDETLQRVS